ncbi:MAG: hypothetical protein V3T83_20475 [Acidobacteriota bacterium]
MKLVKLKIQPVSLPPSIDAAANGNSAKQIAFRLQLLKQPPQVPLNLQHRSRTPAALRVAAAFDPWAPKRSRPRGKAIPLHIYLTYTDSAANEQALAAFIFKKMPPKFVDFAPATYLLIGAMNSGWHFRTGKRSLRPPRGVAANGCFLSR